MLEEKRVNMNPDLYNFFCKYYRFTVTNMDELMMDAYPDQSSDSKDFDMGGLHLTLEVAFDEMTAQEKALTLMRVSKKLAEENHMDGAQRAAAAAQIQGMIDWTQEQFGLTPEQLVELFTLQKKFVEKELERIAQEEPTETLSVGYYLRAKHFLENQPYCPLQQDMTNGVRLDQARGGQPDWLDQDWSASLPNALPTAKDEQQSLGLR